MGHKIIGSLHHDDKIFDHGESISASNVGGKENFETLVAAGSVVTDEEFKRLYPDAEGEVVQPSGTPSNLGEVEGTKLQAPDQTDGKSDGDDGDTAPPNPANPPQVKGAGKSEKK